MPRRGIGRTLLRLAEGKAIESGYTKLFVETYAHRDFSAARGFYLASGFTEKGRIADYLPDGSAMLVFGKELSGTG